jgi:hypothetical protein
MKTGEVEFRFPVLGISGDNDLWGFHDYRQLTTCGRRTLRDDMQKDLELVDASGRRWKVTGVRRLGRSRSFLPWLFWALLAGPNYSIEQDLEPLEALTLDEIKDRVCAAMEAHPEFWCDDPESKAELAKRLKEVRRVKKIAGIDDVLGLDTFEPY